jgi:4-amino-4-deoxy-L-arabinose transferase-like glycosyltransferase
LESIPGVIEEIPLQGFRGLFVDWQRANVTAFEMGAASQSVKLKKSWISEHPLVVIGVILAGCLGPFINKAIHVDDALFVWAAEWIQKHPANFYGSEVDIWGSAIPMWMTNWNPPLMSYFLAGVAALFGWHEIVLHLACLVVAFTAAAGIYSLAKMWCARPLLATVVAMFTPAFLVSSTTLMCDVLMLAFWIWAVVLWERALGSEQSRWQYVGAGVLAGLAVLTKYSALILLPLLPILSLLRTRKLGWWWLGLAVPLAMVVGYEWLTARMYGRGLLFAAAGYVQTSGLEFLGGWKAKGVIGLAFTGGSLLPLLFFAPWLWRGWALLAISVVILGISLGICRFGGNLGLIFAWQNPGLMDRWDFLLQVGVLAAAGVHLLLLVGAEAWRRRDIISVMLVLWIISELFFPTVLHWKLAVRRFLPLVPAVAILLVRRLGASWGNSPAGGWLLWPLVPAAAVTLSVAVADYQLANSARTAAEQIAAQYKPMGHELWFEGGYGTFQYYMEKLGGQRIDVEQSLLQPGDIVVVPWFNNATLKLPPGSVGWLDGLRYKPYSWMNTWGDAKSTIAGFYGADSGPVPFAVGGLPDQVYFVVKVFSTVQYHTQPANWREVQAGGVPSFTNAACSIKGNLSFQLNPEAEAKLQLASQCKAGGKIEEAIQHSREALDVDSNNPVALSNLAWILTTANQPELRNGEEPVRLATKAVKLTDSRVPLFIGTLSVAYAEAGQISRAIEVGNVAHNLALLTGQQDVAHQIAKLLTLYASGKTVDTTLAP